MAKANGVRRASKAGGDDSAVPPDVAAVIAELGTEAAHVSIWRLDEPGEPYLGRVAASEFTLDWVQLTHGGGKYRIRVANAANAWIKAHTFAIAGKAKSPPATPGAAESNGTGTHASNGASGLPKWLETVLIATLPVIAGAVAKKMLESPAPDPLMLALINKSGRGEGISPIELANLLETLRQNTRQETIEMLGERGAPKAVPTSWADVVIETVPALVDTFRREQDRDERPPRRARATVAGTTPTTTAPDGVPPVTQPTAPAGEPEWLSRVRPYVPMACGLADRGKNPEIQADALLDTLSESVADNLGEHALSPTFVADVFAAIPAFSATSARVEWFTLFLTRLQESFGDDGDESAATPAPAGHASAAEGATHG